MKKRLREIAAELIYIFMNYFVNAIPLWCVRRALYSLFGMKIGKGARILMKTVVVSPWKITIGKGSTINEHCFLDGRGRLDIGDNVTVAVYSKIITASHNIDSPGFDYVEEKVTIGDNSALFANTIVTPGCCIGSGCIFAAGSVVKRGEYPENGVYGGNPVKSIKRRDIYEFDIKSWTPWFR